MKERDLGTDIYGAPLKCGRDFLGEDSDPPLVATGIGGPYPVTHDDPVGKKTEPDTPGEGPPKKKE